MKSNTFALLGVVFAIGAIAPLYAAPVTFQGAATLSLRPDPANLARIYDANTFNNELIFIIRDESNASLQITNIFDPVLRALDRNPSALVDRPLEISDTNPCKGVTLNPNDVCAFSVLFDTSGPDDGLSNRWSIGEQISVKYLTQPFPIPSTVPVVNPLRVRVTVQDAALTGIGPTAVPEPGTFALIGFALALTLASRRYFERYYFKERMARAAVRPVRIQSGSPMPS
jgi:PEP-CTERM motif